MMIDTTLEQALKDFIAIPTIAHNAESNVQGIQWIRQQLEAIGFYTEVKGNSPYQQPVLIAEYKSTQSKEKVVLYGHYDVERIHASECWDSPPFQLTVKDGRYYGRGVADNKGILLARIRAVQTLVEKGEVLPNILWIVQGEEEVAGSTLIAFLANLLEQYNAALYVEETGVHQEGCPVLFHLPQVDEPPVVVQQLNQHLFEGKAAYANRSLTKFTPCPFLNSLPKGAQYIGFGPNDAQCNIHRPNESIDIQALEAHQQLFSRFLKWVAVAGNYIKH